MTVASLPRCVLITPARNEARFIELTLKSMVRQTVQPLRWIVVSDGSTDGTDEIVQRYADKYSWIELLRLSDRGERHFAGKVHAFNAGFDRAADLPYDVVGNVDGDVSFGDDHLAYVLEQFAQNERLGVAGTPFREGTFQYDYRFSNVENVWGGYQLFRRQCFRDIGGYRPLKGGCIDHVAVVSARMKGWTTRTFTGRLCTHHRDMGTAQRGWLSAKFRMGAKDHSVGNHPLWELSRVLYQMTQSPAVIGGIVIGSGYVWSMARRAKVVVPKDIVDFIRQEQMQRLRRFLGGAIGGNRTVAGTSL